MAVIFFNTFVNPIALEAIAWKYYFVFIVVLLTMCFTVYFYYPETKGYTLEHMAVIFDGEDAMADSKEAATRAKCVFSMSGKYFSTAHEEKVSSNNLAGPG